MLTLIGGLYLGWALGANNASNVFGTAVAFPHRQVLESSGHLLDSDRRRRRAPGSRRYSHPERSDSSIPGHCTSCDNFRSDYGYPDDCSEASDQHVTGRGRRHRRNRSCDEKHAVERTHQGGNLLDRYADRGDGGIFHTLLALPLPSKTHEHEYPEQGQASPGRSDRHRSLRLLRPGSEQRG